MHRFLSLTIEAGSDYPVMGEHEQAEVQTLQKHIVLDEFWCTYTIRLIENNRPFIAEM